MFAIILHPSDELLLAREQQRFLENADGAWIPSFPLWAFFDGREPPFFNSQKEIIASLSIETPRVEKGEFFFPVALVMKNSKIVRGKISVAKQRITDDTKKINKTEEGTAPSHDETNGEGKTAQETFVAETCFPLSCRVFRAAHVEVTESSGMRTWLSRTSVWIKTRP